MTFRYFVHLDAEHMYVRLEALMQSSKKGIYLGFAKDTTKNIIWYDPETNNVKIAKHKKVDEHAQRMTDERSF